MILLPKILRHVWLFRYKVLCVALVLIAIPLVLARFSPTKKTTTNQTTPVYYASELKMRSQKTLFKPTEKPSFKIGIGKLSTGKTSMLDRFLGSIGMKTQAFADDTPLPELKIKANRTFRETDTLKMSVRRTSSDEVEVYVDDVKAFRPGKYTMTITSGNRNIEQDFTWGVLAVNTNKSIYSPGETARIGFAVLDDIGRTKCMNYPDPFVTGKVWLTITSPDGKKTELTTQNGKVTGSADCAEHSVTNNADFQTTYKTTIPGIYQMHVIGENQNGKRSIDDYFEVKNNQDIIVERTSLPTRIYPSAKYTNVITVTTMSAFKGQIIEKTPASFHITCTDCQVQGNDTVNPDNKEPTNIKATHNIVWDVDWKAGEKHTLAYTFDPPRISPEFYILGPLQVTSGDKIAFEEVRPWQIASDAIVTWNGNGGTNNWNLAGNWAGGVACTGAANNCTFDGSNPTNGQKNATINVGISVASVDINSGYTGTITQAGTITTSATVGFSQADGTFTGASQAITHNSGGISVTGGTYSGTTGTTTFYMDLSITGGTFTKNGTFTFTDGGSKYDTTITCSQTLGGTVNLSKSYTSVQSGTAFTLASGCTISGAAAVGTTYYTGATNGIVINGDFTLSSGTMRAYRAGVSVGASGTLTVSSGATVQLYKDFTAASGATIANSGTIEITDGGAKYDTTITCSTTIGGTVNLTKTYTSGSTGTAFTLASGCTISSAAAISNTYYMGTTNGIVINGDFTLSSGTMRAYQSGVSVGASGTLTVSSGATLMVYKDFTAASGATIANSGTIEIADGGSKYDTTVTCSTTIGGTVNLTKTYTGGQTGTAFTLASGCTISSATAAGTNWFTGSTNGIVINGDITLTSGTWHAYIASVSIPDGGKLTINSGATLDVYKDFTAGTTSGNAVANSGTIAFSQAYNSTLTCAQTISGTITLGKTTGVASFTLSTNCTVSNAVASGTTNFKGATYGIVINGTMTLTGATALQAYQSGVSIPSGGSLTVASGASLVSGKDLNAQGTISNNNGGTITMSDNGGSSAATLSCGASTDVGALVINKASGGSVVLGSDCTTGALTRTAGVINNPASAYTLKVKGNMLLQSTTNIGGANMTISMEGSTDTTFNFAATSTTFVSKFQVNKTGTAKASLITTALVVTGQTCKVVEGTFDLNAINFTCTTGFTVENGGNLQLVSTETLTSPTLDSGSTVTYKGDGDGVTDTFTMKAYVYHHLTINSATGNADIYQPPAAFTGANDINGDLTITLGTFDVKSGSNYGVDVVGSFSNAGTFLAQAGTLKVGTNFTNTGTFTQGTGTVEFNTASTTVVTGSASPVITFNNLTIATNDKTVNFTAGKTFRVNGVITITGTSGHPVNINSTSGSQWFMNHQGTESIAWASVTNSGCDGTSTTITMDANSVNNGNNGVCWSFPVVNITVSGNIYSDEGSSAYDCSANNITVYTSVNGAANDTPGTCTLNTGAFSITATKPTAAAQPIVIFIDSGESIKATTVTLTADATSNITGIKLYVDHLVLTHEDSGPMTNAKLATGDNGDAGIRYSVASSNLTVESGIELFVYNSKTYTPGGTVTTQGSLGDFQLGTSATTTLGTATNTISNDIIIGTSATLNVNTDTIVGGGDITVTGTLNTTSGTPTLTMRGTGSISGAGSKTVYNLLLGDGTTATTTLSGSLTANNDVTVGTGSTLNQNASLNISGGDFTTTTTGIVNTTSGTGTVTITGTGNVGAGAGGSFTVYTLAANGTQTLASDITTTNNVSVATGGSLALASKNVSISGGGMTTAGTGTITCSACSAGTVTISGTGNIGGGGAVTVYNLTSSSGTQTISSSTTVSNTLTVNGTINGTSNLTVNADFAGTGTMSMTGGTTEQRVGANQNFGTTSGSNAWSFDTLIFSNSTGTSKTVTTQTGGSGGVTVTTLLQVGKGGDSAATVLDAGNRTWTLSGTSGTPFTVPQGSVTASTSTFNYTGNNGAGNTTITDISYTNLTVNNGSETWVLAASPLNINGNLIVTAGTLSLSTNSMNVGSTSVANSGGISVSGTLTQTSGGTTTVLTSASGASSIGGSGTITFYTLTIAPTAASGTITLGTGSSQTITVNNNLNIGDGSNAVTVTANTNNPILDVNGNFTTNASGTFVAPPSASFTIAGNMTNNGTFTHNSGTVTFDSTTTATLAGSASPAITFNNVTIATSDKTVLFTSTETFRTNGLLTITGTSGHPVTIDATSNGSQWLINHQGTEAVTYAAIQDSGCSSSTDITLNTTNTNNSNNGTCWVFSSDISGIIYSNEGTTPFDCSAANLTIDLAINGGTNYTATCNQNTGAFSFTTVPQPSSGTPMAIFVDNANVATAKATTITRAPTPTTSITGIKLYINHIVVSHEDSGPITNANLSTADNTDAGIRYAVASSNLTVDSGMELYVLNSKTYTPGGTVTTQGGSDFQLASSATSTLGTATNAIDGDIVVDTGATLTINTDTTVAGGAMTTAGTGIITTSSGTPTITVSGTGSIGGGGTVTVYNLTANGTQTLASALTANNNVTVGTGGVLDLGSQDMTVSGGSFTNTTTGIIRCNSCSAGTLTLPATGTLGGGSGNITLYNLTTSGTGTTTFSGAGTNTISNNVTVGTGTTLNINSDIAITGSLSNTTTGIIGTSAGTPTVTVSGTTLGGGSGAITFYNLTKAGAGTTTFSGSGTNTVSNNLSVSNGTLTLSNALTVTNDGSVSTGATFNINADLAINGGDMTTAGTGVINTTSGTPTVTISGTGTLGSGNGNITFYNLTTTGTGTTTFSGAGTNSATNNVSVGAGTTLNINSSITITGSLTNTTSGVIGTTAGTPTVTVQGTSIGGGTTGAITFYNLTKSGAGTTTFSNGGTNTINNNLSVTAGTLTQSDALTVTNDIAVSTSATFNINADLAINGGDMTTAGTGVINTTSGTPTVTISGTGTIGGGGTVTVYNLTSSSGTQTISSATTINNTLTVNGTINGSSNLTVTAGFTGSGTVSMSGGTTEHRVGANQNFGSSSGSNNWSFATLIFSNSTGSSKTITADSGGSGSITASTLLQVGKGGDSAATVLDAGARTWTLSGTTGTPFTVPQGSVTVSTSTFNYTGNYASGNTTIRDISYYNLTVNNGSETWNLAASPLTVTSTLTVTAGTLDLQTNSATIGSSSVTNSGNIAVAGTLTQSAGGTTTVVTSAAGSATIGGAGTITFYSLTIAPTVTGSTVTLGSAGSQTITVSNNLSIGDGSNTVTVTANTNNPILDVNGNVTINASATFVAPPSASFTIAGNMINNGTFTHNSGTVTFDSTTTATLAGSASPAITFNNVTVATSDKTMQFTNAETFRINGLLTITGTSGHPVTIQSDSTGVQWLVNHQGTEAVTYAAIKDSGCDPSSTSITLDSTNTNNENNGACWVFTMSVTGNIYTDEGSTAYDCSADNLTVHLSLNGGTNYDATCSLNTGAFTFSLIPQVAAGTPMAIFIDSIETPQATTITRTPTITSSISGIKLYQNHLNLSHEDSGPITNTDLATADNGDVGIRYAVGSGNLTVDSGITLYIYNGKTYNPGGTVTTNTTGGDFKLGTSAVTTLGSATTIGADITVGTSATLNINADTTVGGGDITTTGTLTTTSGTPTVTMRGTGTVGGAGSSTFYTLAIGDGTTATSTLGTDITVSNNMSVATGSSLALASKNVTVSGGTMSTAGTGTITCSGCSAGTVTISGTGNIGGGGAVTVYNLTSSSGTQTISSATTVSNTLTTNGTLAGSSTLTVNGSMAGTGSMSMTGTTEQRVGVNQNFGTTSGSNDWSFATLIFSNSTGVSKTITTQTGGSGSITASTLLQVGKGGDSAATVLDAGNRTWTLSGTTGTPFTIPQGSITVNTSTFNYTGNYASGNTTITNTSYYNLTVNNASETWNLAASPLTVTNALTVTAGTLDLQTNSATIGSSSVTNSGNIAVTGTLTQSASGTTTVVTSAAGTNTIGGSGAITFYNLSLAPTVSGSTVTLGSAGSQTITVSNNLSIGDGSNTVTATASSNNPNIDVNGSFTINSSGTFVAPPSSNFTIAANMTNNGTFTANNGTVTFDSATTAVIAGSASPAITFYNITSSTLGKTLTFTVGETFRTNGLITFSDVSINSTTSSQWFINHQGTESITGTTITNSGCDGASTDITLVGTDVNGGNNGACWVFAGALIPSRLNGTIQIDGDTRIQ